MLALHLDPDNSRKDLYSQPLTGKGQLQKVFRDQV
jgi:hypothetical protein